jgi:hypothetical protein
MKIGFDVTFHPIATEELHYFFFDVIADSALAKPRSSQVSTDPKRQAVVNKLYKAFPHWLAAREQVGSSFAFGAAIIAGFLHPFWYARGQGLSFLLRRSVLESPELFVPLGRIVQSRLTDLPDTSCGLIRANESASGYIPPDRILLAQNLLNSLATRTDDDGRTILDLAFDSDGLKSVRAALHFCAEKNLGMIEASDVVVPISNDCFTDQANMRAPFLGMMDP